MITFAALTPHSPLLLDSIGKENSAKLEDTRNALQQLSEELYASHPDVIICISPHADLHENAFSINLHDEYFVEFHEFGDLAVHAKFEPDLKLISAIQRGFRHHELPFTLDSHAQLDYGMGVPLLLLTKHFKNKPKIVPIACSGRSAKDHFQFGRELKEILALSDKKIAIIASGDLSHALVTTSPAGFKPEGEIFDKAIIQAIESGSSSQLLSLDPEFVAQATECVNRPLLMLFGLLDRTVTRPEILSYEHPFGIGQLVAQFHLEHI